MSILLILGAGGHAKVVAETALASGHYSVVAFLDDRCNGPDQLPSVLGFPVLGPLALALELIHLEQFAAAAVAFGNATARLIWIEQLDAAGYALPVLIHPTAWVSPSAQLGPGSVVFAQAAVQSLATIGVGAILNTGCSVDHDVQLADGVHICPGARLAGEVHVGSRSWIGIGSSVIQQVRIGSDVTIGAGAAVVRDLPDGVTAVGVPARVLPSSDLTLIPVSSPVTLPPWPHFDTEQIDAASRVLASGKVNTWTGQDTKTFEEEYARWCGSSHAIAMANGSLALSAAYLALGLGQGDELITTPRTFIATASSAVLLGAKPVFADVERDSGAITAASIAPLITPRTKAIAVVHLGGWPADMPAICDLARAHGLAVIEDCAQAHGARLHGQSVGSFGDVASWSFCQDKILSTAGEGGMVTTSRDDLWDAMWAFKDHGKTHEAVFGREHPPGFRWLHERFGSNFRLAELQSAIGRIQLQRLPDWTAARTRNALLLAEALGDLPAVRVPLPPEGIEHAWYKFYAFVKPDALADGWSRDRILSEITEAGYPAFSGSCSEIYLEKCFQDAGLAPAERLPVARELGDTSLMFLVHPTITPEQMAGYADAVRTVVELACR